jgi:steroid 5-alpha reductase family enzyme
VRRWDGLKDEDWRYSYYREKMGKNFWIINFVGLQFMPTIVVYLGSLSLFPTILVRSGPFGFIDIIAVVITAAAILIEALADQQLFNFLKNRKDSEEILTSGLWKYSRYPNYLGEIMFWWGLYIFVLAANLSYFWAVIGPISITILFNFVSIPLMEKRHLKRKPNYLSYKKQTSKLIPWIPKKNPIT